jgi:hypothetical protein
VSQKALAPSLKDLNSLYLNREYGKLKQKPGKTKRKLVKSKQKIKHVYCLDFIDFWFFQDFLKLGGRNPKKNNFFIAWILFYRFLFGFSGSLFGFRL